jgi:hypothetical protein
VACALATASSRVSVPIKVFIVIINSSFSIFQVFEAWFQIFVTADRNTRAGRPRSNTKLRAAVPTQRHRHPAQPTGTHDPVLVTENPNRHEA